jgi:hypothetical protein
MDEKIETGTVEVAPVRLSSRGGGLRVGMKEMTSNHVTVVFDC